LQLGYFGLLQILWFASDNPTDAHTAHRHKIGFEMQEFCCFLLSG